MPLPCSPTTSESQSFPTTSEDESTDVSLTTPRPGPADPAQRTDEQLSRPSIAEPPTSPESVKGPSSSLRTNQEQATAVHVESSNLQTSPGPSSPTATTAVVISDRPRSVTFLRQTSSPKRRAIYSSQSSMSHVSPTASASGEARIPREEDESSADESTAIFRRENAAGRQYGALLADVSDPVAGSSTARRRTSLAKGKDAQTDNQDVDTQDAGEGWWKRMLLKYGSVELDNKGSVARDHLALERTFLAWLRTSLSFASIGIAVTQLFRLNTSLTNPDNGSNPDSAANLRSVGKPLGATFLGISILILLLGFHRYFESQHYVIRGKFPASRGSIVLVAFVAGGLIVASLAVVLAIAPTAFES